jgi:undecaprenyl diphosphate synthase
MNFMLQSKMHVAIIMDGNGRWAAARALPRLAGHRRGVETLRRVIEAAPGLDIGTLTLYAFSSDNWKRPQEEVAGLMGLFEVYLGTEVARLADAGVRLSFIGRRDRLPVRITYLLAEAEAATRNGKELHVRVAVDYSGRDMLLRAAASSPASRSEFAAALGRAQGGGDPAPDVDLVIRTGGEQRLSDFLLWECAYAELLFLDCAWPDFDERELSGAVSWFRHRDRRFGALTNGAGRVTASARPI